MQTYHGEVTCISADGQGTEASQLGKAASDAFLGTHYTPHIFQDIKDYVTCNKAPENVSVGAGNG